MRPLQNGNAGAVLSGLLLGTGVFVVASAVVPLPSFAPAPPRARPIPPAAGTQLEPPQPFPEQDWMGLKDTLNVLRPPPPEPVTPVEEPTGAEDGSATPVAPPTPPRPALSWQYKGLIDDDRPYALVILQGGKQRFLGQGELIDDPLAPGQKILIKQVTPDALIIERDGVEHRIPRDRTATPMNPIMGGNPAQFRPAPLTPNPPGGTNRSN